MKRFIAVRPLTDFRPNSRGQWSRGSVGCAVLAWAASAWAAVACGPSYNESTIKTADERMREQEELAYKEELAERQRPDAPVGPVEDEIGVFDENHAQLEFRQATLSAETCPEVAVVDKKTRWGSTTVTVSFGRDGLVSEATIPPPHDGTQLGSCVLNAFKRINVPPYRGELRVITWDVNLKKPKK